MKKFIDTQFFKEAIDNYLIKEGKDEVPLKAKSFAINILQNNFEKLDANFDIDDEFIFLLEKFPKEEPYKIGRELNSFQKEFIFLQKKSIIEEHEDYLNKDGNKTFEEKIMGLDVQGALGAFKDKSDVQIANDLYFYYLGLYEDFLPDEKKPKILENIPIPAQRSFYRFNKLIWEFDNANRDGKSIFTDILNLIINCSKELEILKAELGVQHKIYVRTSSEITMLTINKIDQLLATDKIGRILFFPSKDLLIGKNFAEVCDKFYEEISKIEMDVKSRQNLDKSKNHYLAIKKNAEPHSACYIATMTYGDYNHPNVVFLRQYRDERLLTNPFGKLFVKAYYFISPKIVNLFKGNEFVIKLSRACLDFLINKCLSISSRK